MQSFKKMLAAGTVLALGMTSATQAQVAVDMSKFTCEQLLRGTANSVEAAIWLSGYYNGTRKNTMLDLGKLKQNSEAVVKECTANPKKTVMQSVETLLGKK